MTTTTTPGDDIKTRILDAAADEFMNRGLASTTVDDIADRVGATKGLIYYHFKSKFDIFLAVYESGMNSVARRVEHIAAGPGSGQDRLRSMSVAHVVTLMDNLSYHHVVQQGVRILPLTATKPRQRDALSELNELREAYEALFLSVVTAGVADGSLRQTDAGLAARVLLSSLNAVDAWYRVQPDQSDADRLALATASVELILGGLTP